ncbi:hypothetical protein [Herpetosiphon gulosus]|uniref:Uncharacterized protein n=1 Tax=Herpetosiphon gulosus TaxID=1973496 RepID=A0ABP9X1H6_9CHLR
MQCPRCTMAVPVPRHSCPYCEQKLVKSGQGLFQPQNLGFAMMIAASLILLAIFLPLLQIDQSDQAFKLIDTFMRNQLAPWPERWRLMGYTLVGIGVIAFICGLRCFFALHSGWATLATSVASFSLVCVRVVFKTKINGASYGLGFWVLLVGGLGVLISGFLVRHFSRTRPNNT